jgi:hypothetical protein
LQQLNKQTIIAIRIKESNWNQAIQFAKDDDDLNGLPESAIEYLLIQRKDSLGYVDFLRGKYSEYNDYQLKNIIKEMTINEIDNILNYSYKELWDKLWNKITEKYDLKNEEKFIYVKKFNMCIDI